MTATMRSQRILCPVDFSNPSRQAFEAAAERAREDDAKLTIITIYRTAAEARTPIEPDLLPRLLADAEREVAQLKEEARSIGVKDVTGMALEGVPWDQIVRIAEIDHTDLIIMGTQGRTGIEHALLGSVAERVVRHAPCDVLFVRQPRN